jgi:hypothetical protein
MDPPKFIINYVKTKPIDWKSLEETYVCTPEDIEFEYNPFAIDKIQNYNPIYSKFFIVNEKNYDSIALNHNYHYQGGNTLSSEERSDIPKQKEWSGGILSSEGSIFIKYSPLLDPYRFMTGKYKKNTGLDVLPSPFSSYVDSDLAKLRDPNNASYVDNFFSFLASKLMHQHGINHCLDYYGSFLGVQKCFKVNVSDDLEFLQASDYFLENVNKSFMMNLTSSEYSNMGSRSNKIKLKISGETHNITAFNLTDDLTEGVDDNKEDASLANIDEVIYEKEGKISGKGGSDHSSTSSSKDSEDSISDDELDMEDGAEIKHNSDEDNEGSTSDEGEDWETESSIADEEDENNQFAYIKNFPVQLICLEKGDGTFDELFIKKQLDDAESASALFQVIMTLIAYQQAFHFTHNDLHTNNIMFSVTDQKFLFYKYKKQIYKVPTYGKVFKIIDFGRSIYKFNGQLFCSDSFSAGGDASTQYNTEPYLNEDKPRLDPNYGFDLSRLGCSIYDFIIDDDDPDTVASFGELQKTIYRWCTNDQDKNILYKRNGEERYPNFKLYKMIAKTCHKHTPQEQLKFPFFKQFLTKKAGKEAKIMDLDVLPCYV